MADQAFVHHGFDRAVEDLQAEVYVGICVRAGKDAAAARHQVHATHLQGLPERRLGLRRLVLQGIGVQTFYGPAPELDVEGGGFAVDGGFNLVAPHDLSQAYTNALGHAVGLVLKLSSCN